jgi:hypothetical protein
MDDPIQDKRPSAYIVKGVLNLLLFQILLTEDGC